VLCSPCSSRDARKVLKLMRPFPVGCVDSKELSGDLYSDDHKLGAKLSVWTLKSKLTGLPKNLIASLRTTIFGNFNSVCYAAALGGHFGIERSARLSVPWRSMPKL